MTTPRTSLTHPLQVNTLTLPGVAGRIGLTLCPGKQGGAVHGPPWARDLGLDVHALHAWGAAAVLTLIEAHELDLLAVPELGAAVERAGMAWLHAPITDLDVPGAAFMAAWPALASGLLQRIAGGQAVVVHCRGGLGRTGMLACMLAIELGLAPAVALGAVRAVRPGAVETAAQQRFVLDYRPLLRLGGPTQST